MSRFEKALERARSDTQPGAPSGMAMPEEAPKSDLFDAPWGVAEAPVVAAREPARQPAASVGIAPPAPLQFHQDVAEKVVGHANADSVVVEQYRKLAASLHQWQLERGGKVIMIASAAASEGKTLTALNLALTLSGSYQRRVLLVDCDLRRPTLHGALRIPAQPGISDVAADLPTPPRAVAERLFVIPAGHSTDDPIGTLTSVGMAALLQKARRDFDWVVLDTPPAAGFSDASLLSDQVDGAVLVVLAGVTDFDHVSRAIASIGRERILGVVLNGIDARDMSVGGYPYYSADR